MPASPSMSRAVAWPPAESRNAPIDASSESRPTVPCAEAMTASIVVLPVDVSNWSGNFRMRFTKEWDGPHS